MFNWVDATVQELAVHVSMIPAQHTQTQIRYYKEHGNEAMVEKIYEARKLAKIVRAERRLTVMKESLGGTSGNQI